MGAHALLAPEPFPDWVRGIAKGFLIHTPLSGKDVGILPKSVQSRGSHSVASHSVPLQSGLVADADIANPQCGVNAEEDKICKEPVKREDSFLKDWISDTGLFSCVARSK